MGHISLATTVIVLVAALTGFAAFNSFNLTKRSKILGNQRETVRQFTEWADTENKIYGTPAEREFRLNLFENSDRELQRFKESDSGFEMTLGKFADLTHEEFLAQHTGLLKAPFPMEELGLGRGSPIQYKTLEDIKTPVLHGLGETNDIDWESRGKLGSVRDQEKCGSCFSFAAALLAQSHYAIKNSIKVREISEQHIVDCSKSYGNNGCGGGLIETSLQMIIDIGAMPRSLYPYTAEHMSTCKHDPAKVFKAHSNYASIARERGDLIEKALANGPVGVGVDATALKYYKSGVITARAGLCSSNINHAVLIYGIGTYAGGKYWMIRNSWGSDWGDRGNFKIHAEMSGPGLCGINMQVCQPL